MRTQLTLLAIVTLGLTAVTTASPVMARKRPPEAQRVVPPRPEYNPALPLKPGEYVWYGDRALPGPVEVVMSIPQQRAYAFQAGELIGFATISSGKQGSAMGRFQILEKRKFYRSARYDNAPMPFMMRLNWFGVAMHGGHNPGYPASHGCVRLPVAFAEKLFGTATVGSFVFITAEAPASPSRALAMARANYDATMPDYRLPRGVKTADNYAEASFPNRVIAPSYAEQQARVEQASAPAPRAERAPRQRRSLFGRIGDLF